MKKLTRSPLVTLLMLSIAATWTNAHAGAESSGGGGAVKLRDDTLVLRDPYLTKPGQRFELHPDLVSEIAFVGHLMTCYGAKLKSDEFFNRESAFIGEQVLNRLIDYKFVTAEEIQKVPAPNCREAHPADHLPPGSQDLGTIACTDGPVTWIREDVFRGMSVRQQALLIVHERLHSIGAPEVLIADFTGALDLILDLYRRQKAGERPVLDEEQVARIQQLRRVFEQLQLARTVSAESPDYLGYYEVTPMGGGLIYGGVTLQTGTYVGVGSIVRGAYDPKTYRPLPLPRDLEVLNSRVDGAVETSGSARISDSVVYAHARTISLRVGSRIEASQIYAFQIFLENGAAIVDSSLGGILNLKAGAGSRLEGVQIKGTPRYKPEIQVYSLYEGIHLGVGSSALLRSLQLDVYGFPSFWKRNPANLEIAESSRIEALACEKTHRIEFTRGAKVASAEDFVRLCERIPR